MVLRYRVSLSGIKGFTRVYQLRPNTSLYDFHIILRRDLEFAQDQLIQFKALAKDGSLVARYSMFDLGYGTVDEVSLADTVAKGITSFRYFYDVPNNMTATALPPNTADRLREIRLHNSPFPHPH